MSDSLDRLSAKCDLLNEKVAALHIDTTTIILANWAAAGLVAIAFVIGALVSGVN